MIILCFFISVSVTWNFQLSALQAWSLRPAGDQPRPNTITFFLIGCNYNICPVLAKQRKAKKNEDHTITGSTGVPHTSATKIKKGSTFISLKIYLLN